jgi:hypothetical protein
MSNTKSNQNVPSVEELKKAREDQTQFMKEQIEHLKVREEYTGLKAKIAENIFIEAAAKAKLAQLQIKPEVNNKSSEDES